MNRHYETFTDVDVIYDHDAGTIILYGHLKGEQVKIFYVMEED